MEFYLNNKKGFTLIEILGVIAVFSILFSSFIYIWNSLDIFRKSRDAKRINDLNALDAAIKSILTTSENVFLGEENVIYISLPDNNSNCSSYSLIPIFSPYTYRCQTINNYLKIDGNGWIPVNFTLGKILNLTVLPVDPLNNKDYFYSYQVKGGRYKLTARFESKSNIPKMVNDNGFEPTLYEVGSNLFIPSPQSGLVAYWSFDEATGTIAIDSSGYGNNGTLYSGPQWTTGKIGGALNFTQASNQQIIVNDPLSLRVNNYTIIFWIKFLAGPDNYWRQILAKHTNCSTYPDRSPGIWIHPSYLGLHWRHSPDNSGSNALGFNGENTSFNLNKFYFISGAKEGSIFSLKFFDDQGTEKNYSYTVVNSMCQGPGNFYIGRSPNYFSQGMIIDEVRIYNRVLSPEEIKAIYEATK